MSNTPKSPLEYLPQNKKKEDYSFKPIDITAKEAPKYTAQQQNTTKKASAAVPVAPYNPKSAMDTLFHKDSPRRKINEADDFDDLISLVESSKNDPKQLRSVVSMIGNRLTTLDTQYRAYTDKDKYYGIAEGDFIAGRVPTLYAKDFNTLEDMDAALGLDIAGFSNVATKRKHALMAYNHGIDMLDKLEKQTDKAFNASAIQENGDVDTDAIRTRYQPKIRERDLIANVTKPVVSDEYFSTVPGATNVNANPSAIREKNKERAVAAEEKIDAADYYDKYKDGKYANDFFGRIAANYRMGDIGVKESEAGYNAWKRSTDDIFAADIYDALRIKLQTNNVDTYVNNNGWDEFIATAAAQVPQTIEQVKSGANRGIQGAIIGGIAFNGAGLKEGWSWGYKVGQAEYMFKQTAGNTYVEALRNNADKQTAHELATNTALATAAVNLGLEIATEGVFKLLNKIPGVKKATETTIKKCVADIFQSGCSAAAKQLSEKIGVSAGKVAINAFLEGGEEGAEEAISIQAQKAAKSGEEVSAFGLLVRSFDYNSYTEEERKQIAASAKAGAMLGTFGDAVRVVGGKVAETAGNKITGAIDDRTVSTIEAGQYLLADEKKDFGELSKRAQKIVKKEFKDDPLGFHDFLITKSKDGKLSPEAQAAVDDMLSPLAKKTSNKNAALKVSGTLPVGTEITVDTTGAVEVRAEPTSRVGKLAETLLKNFGVKIGFAEYYQNGVKNTAYNGHYDPSTKTIYFRKGASNAEIIYKTAMHELTHFAEGSRHYAYVSDFVINKLFGGPESAEFKQAIADKIADYKKNGQALTESQARAELVADNVRKVIFAKGEDVRKLVETDYTFAQRILDIIESFLYNFKEKFGLLDGKEQFEAALLQAQRKYRMALAGRKGGSTGVKQNVSFMIKYDEYLGAVAFLDGLKVNRQKGESIQSAIRRDFKNRFKNHLVTVDESNNSVKLDQIKKYVYPGAWQENFSTKMSVYPVLNEMIRIATDRRWNKNLLDEEGNVKKHAGYDCEGGFNYYDTQFAIDSTGVIYGGTIICRIDKSGREFFYDLDKIRTVGYKDEGDFKPQYPRSSNTTVLTDNTVPQTDPAVKNQYSFSSPKTDTAPIGAEDFDVQPKNESNPELEKALSDHDFVKGADGNIRKYGEERAEKSTFQKVKDEFGLTKPPSTDEAPTSNPDVAAVVNTEGLKRAEDIELQYSQRLKGKNAMLFKDLPRVLDYVCDKMPGVRDFWRNRIEKPFWAAKASFARRTRRALTDLKKTADSLGIRVGSKESSAAQWYGEGYRAVVKENPSYEKGNGQPKYVVEREAYTLADLKRDFPTSWENIVAFDKKAREIYNNYFIELNKMLEKVYPDVELRLRMEISDLRREIQTLRDKPDNLRMDIEAVEQDIASLEATLAGLKERRDSGSDISGALDALEQRRVSMQAEYEALKNKGTKKAAHIEKQAAKAADRADALRTADKESFESAIRRYEQRLKLKKDELAGLQEQISERALEINAEKISAKEAEVERKLSEIKSGEALIGKRVQKREDYYHHFQEMSEGFAGLANILFTSDEIDPKLVGVSDSTKPKTKWEGFMQRQGFGPYKADALGGLVKYIQAAEYKLAFDPIIADTRSVIKTLAEDTTETRNANGFILYLTRWADALAGKTTLLDRPLQEITQRKITRALNWLNSRAKSNTLLGSFRNFFAQFMNLPNGFLHIQNLGDWGNGIKNAFATISKKSEAKAAISQSAFLGERYISDLTDSFKVGRVREVLKKPKKLALMMMSAGDKFSANIIWNAAYAQGKRIGLKGADLIAHADDITRRSIGGRGVGEMPPAMESKWLNLIAPFQHEVLNTWNALMQTYRGKDAKTVGQRISGIVMFEAMAAGLNMVTESLGIGSMLPSLYMMLGDVVKTWMEDEEEEELTAEKKVRKSAALAANEVLSYMPFASTAIPFLFDFEDVEALLGKENEVTRYGTGNIGLSGALSIGKKLIEGDVEGGVVDAVSGYAMPWGGGQAKKVYEGFKDFDLANQRGVSASYTSRGQLRFPMERTPENIAKGMLFGKYATKEGREYIDEGRKPLSEKRTAAFNEIVRTGGDAGYTYDLMYDIGDIALAGANDSVDAHKRRAIMDSILTPQHKSIMDAAMVDERENPVNYSSETSYVISEKFPDDSNRKKAYDLVNSGMTAKDAVLHMENINVFKADKDEHGNEISGDEMKKKIKYIYNLDIPDAQKGALYRNCIIGENKSYILARAYGLDDATLAKTYPILSAIEASKDANGKTIPNSRNEKVKAAISMAFPDLNPIQVYGLYAMFLSGTEGTSCKNSLVSGIIKTDRFSREFKVDFLAWYLYDNQYVDKDKMLKELFGK